MDTYADQNKDNKKQSKVNPSAEHQQNKRSTFQFVDNRPEAKQQRSLVDMINNSQRVKQLKKFQDMADRYVARQQQPIQRREEKKENNTRLPDNLKEGVENLSGYSMDDVKVHYNSDKPAQLNAHAYAQGTDIHIATGQEKHLPHEAWHVVQQKQGRVKPTMQLKGGVDVNDDVGLEKEADVMGAKAAIEVHMSNPPRIFQRRAESAEAHSQLKSTSEQGEKGPLNFLSSGIKPLYPLQFQPDPIQMIPMVDGQFLDPTPKDGDLLNATGKPLISPLFSIVARFDPTDENTDEDETKYSYGQYRQYVRGAFKINGDPQTHILKDGQMQEDEWLEDIIARKRYGYRGHSGGAPSSYFDDAGFSQKNLKGGRYFRSFDQPQAGYEDDEMDLSFKGDLIDTGDSNRIITSRHWRVYGKIEDVLEVEPSLSEENDSNDDYLTPAPFTPASRGKRIAAGILGSIGTLGLAWTSKKYRNYVFGKDRNQNRG